MTYGVELWGWEEKKELEKILYDYVRWTYRLDFCTPRYIMARELGIENHKIEWGIRAMRHEERMRKKKEEELAKKCWNEKESYEERNLGLYEKEREKFYNKNGWSRKGIEINREIGNNMEIEIRERGRNIQKQEEERRIREAKYNKEYEKIKAKHGIPEYLKEDRKIEYDEWSSRGCKIRALVKTRCGNLEEGNKYWIEEGKKKCSFCNRGKDIIEHFVECEKIKEWFTGLGANEKEKIRRLRDENMNEEKGKALVKLWKEKEKTKSNREEENKNQ